jgi:hypothetical protein
VHGYARTFRGERARAGRPDPTRRARDEHAPAFQPGFQVP